MYGVIHRRPLATRAAVVKSHFWPAHRDGGIAALLGIADPRTSLRRPRWPERAQDHAIPKPSLKAFPARCRQAGGGQPQHWGAACAPLIRPLVAGCLCSRAVLSPRLVGWPPRPVQPLPVMVGALGAGSAPRLVVTCRCQDREGGTFQRQKFNDLTEETAHPSAHAFSLFIRRAGGLPDERQASSRSGTLRVKVAFRTVGQMKESLCWSRGCA